MGRPWEGWVIAANDVGCHVPVLHHWVTLHPEKLGTWEKQRRDNGHPGGYVTWGRRQHPHLDERIKSWGGGASGLLAVAVAIDHLEAERVVLCGVPMDRTPHFDESTVHKAGKPWSSANSHWKAWKKESNLARMGDRVCSMSGRTMELLGLPTAGWMDGQPEENEP